MTGALSWARLSFRQQRWELILVAVGVALTAAAMLWFAQQLRDLTVANPACAGGDTLVAGCGAIGERISETRDTATRLLYLSFAAPFGMGVLLGGPLVAREIEGRTAQLAWTLAPSRVSWLLRRIAFVALFALLALGVLAVASELLSATLAPGVDFAHDFQWIGRRGWLVVARGVGALGIGLLVGAALGRVLPAILAAALLIALAFTGVSLLQDRWLDSVAVITRTDRATGMFQDPAPGALYVGAGIETPDGTTYTWEEANDRGIEATYIDEHGEMFASEADMRAGRALGRDIQFLVPGSRYPEAVGRDAAMSLGIGAVTLGGAGLLVRRRRPA